MKIHLVHPKFISDDAIREEHDFLHELFQSLSGDEEAVMEHPDAFLFKGRRGQLYMRHRKLVEEMNTRGIPHLSIIDRRAIEAEEWDAPETTPEQVLAEVESLREGAPGRVPLPDGSRPEDFTCPDHLSSLVAGAVEDEVLEVMWKVVKFLVMERSYAHYRSLSQTLQGRRRGAVWMLFDLLVEEALGIEQEAVAPITAYETIWEMLEGAATAEEKGEYARLMGQMTPGIPSLDMRRHLALTAARQGNKELEFSLLLSPYLEGN
ncbi:MAG: DUF1722 domain-containing protein [bacterium]|nr:MAG: DUF1722 domain-containing protein [bacterium]